MRRTVLVTDAERGSAIAFIRSLDARGWHVIAADSTARSAGFRSRHAAECLVYPAPERSPRAFVDYIEALVRRRSIDLIVPVTDPCIHPLAHARARFEGRTRLAIPPPGALAIVTDKRATVALASRLGIPVPETRAVGTVAEAHLAAAELGYPLVVKPAVSCRYLPEEDRLERGSVSYACDPEELERRVQELAGRELLLQEYVCGRGVGVECLAREGRVVRMFQHARLAEIPPTGGASAWRESVPLDPELCAHVEDLVGELAWTGLIMVEFKLGRRRCLLEINGRVWGSLPLASLAGVDFPGELGELLCPNGGAPAGSGDSYRIGVRAYNLELMLSWIVQVLIGGAAPPGLTRPGRARALRGLLGLLDPAQKSDLSGRDRAPRLGEAERILRKLLRKLLGPAPRWRNP
jgi:predicted ATP-grasp superfamily ATP-dependent carboligase